ncbi:MAG: flagellar type III secretion system pore protein FliP [Planctomycetes bacterium]|nr:flagellar type III secretion system pore protein FliP [Planctomycetota bacterium]
MVCRAGRRVEARRHEGARTRLARALPRRCGTLLVALLLLSFGAAGPVLAQDSTTTVATPATDDDPIFIPAVPWLEKAKDKESLSSTLQIVVLLTVLTVAPSILLMMTSFVRMLIVLVLLRQALGTQQLPPSQVLIGLALFMTILVMAPTWQRVRAEAIDPYLNDEKTQMEAISITGEHLREYMFRQIENTGNEQDVYMMYEYAEQRAVPEDEVLRQDDVSMIALVPAFLLSELKTAFSLGFRIYLPFLVIDMVIATVLVSMGMMMLPPVLISLPFKLLLFVLADGWHLVVETLLSSFA